MNRIPIGLNRTRITIQRRTLTSDSAGSFTEAWSNLYVAVGANVSRMEANEQDRYQREGTTATHLAFIDRDLAIREVDRAVSGSTAYNIKKVEDIDGKGSMRRLVLEEVR